MSQGTMSSFALKPPPPLFFGPGSLVKIVSKGNGIPKNNQQTPRVVPSIALKSPINQHRKMDYKLRLAVEESRLHRLCKLYQAKRHRAVAEERYAEKQGHEMQLLMYIAERPNTTPLEPHLALTLARATCEVLITEEDVANSRLEECLRLLDTLHDAVDDAQACAQEANAQIGTVLNIVDQDDAPVDLSNAANCYKPTLLIRSQSPSFSDSTPPLDTDFSADFDFDPENPPNNPLDYE